MLGLIVLSVCVFLVIVVFIRLYAAQAKNWIKIEQKNDELAQNLLLMSQNIAQLGTIQQTLLNIYQSLLSDRDQLLAQSSNHLVQIELLNDFTKQQVAREEKLRLAIGHLRSKYGEHSDLCEDLWSLFDD